MKVIHFMDFYVANTSMVDVASEFTKIFVDYTYLDNTLINVCVKLSII